MDKIGIKEQGLFVLLIMFNFLAALVTAVPSIEAKNDDSSNLQGILGWLGLLCATILFFLLMLCLAYKCRGPVKRRLIWILPFVGVLVSAIAIPLTCGVCFGVPGATPQKTAFYFILVGILLQMIVTVILLWGTQRIASKANHKIIKKYYQSGLDALTTEELEIFKKTPNYGYQYELFDTVLMIIEKHEQEGLAALTPKELEIFIKTPNYGHYYDR